MIPGWLAEASLAFWEAAGEPPPYPRDLDRVIPFALPVAQVVLPALAIHRMEAWLLWRGVGHRFAEPDRRLRGGLVALGDGGFIFVDGADGPDEQRFTRAHEAAHFLLDYLQPRRRALALLGDGVRPALDGQRPPSREERIDAALTDCPLGIHVHLLNRRDPSGHIDRVEDRADRLACELLAPDAELERRFGGALADDDELTAALCADFGFPPAEAATYAGRWLAPRRRPTLLGGLRR